VFETWGIGASTKRGRGISALFHGDSGTGKTMAAEVVANELGRPLLRCDASSVLSKYVGESEQNLAETFTEAKAAGAVLLFDEADALLRARGSSGGNDVHGDKLVATFLQLIERHDGVVILTTNLGSLLDSALERRFMYCLRFPLPDAQAREKIWSTLLPPTVPRDGELDLAALARRYEAAGGFIRNAVIKAAQRAALAGTGVSQQLLDAAAAEVMPQLTKVARVVGFER
jgi:SpoVK/Ycf46/Vps4 family AAA+-type ATPase